MREPDQLSDDYCRTEVDIDVRSGQRHFCVHLAPIRVLVKPTFRSISVHVRDISANGIGLRPIEPWPCGSQIALNWHFGGPAQHRTVLAHVVHATWDSENGWLIGCTFETPLSVEDLQSLLGHDRV